SPIDNTASGNEAVLKCDQGRYCCDANRPDVADPNGGLRCCDTLKKPSDFFALPNEKPISSTFSSPSLATTSTAASIRASVPNGIVLITANGIVHTRTVLVTSVIINSASSLSSIITLTTTVPQSTSNTSDFTQTSSAKNLGIKIGVGAGVPIGISALAALFFFLWRRQKGKRQVIENLALPTDSNPTEFMYKDHVDLGSPYTTTTTYPELDSRPLGRYSGMESGPEHTEYREHSIAGLGMHYTSATQVPNSPSPRLSELSAETSPRLQRDSRISQTSELVGSDSHPHELPADQTSR
ncbi:hypothetical protein MMC07_009059, partial [Pseudocyphellaria aurata]|nr:hypothetical protein [Pseudocyphellaria aurata]